MHFINCSHRLPPAPAPGEVTPYIVMVKLPGVHKGIDHKAYEEGVAWDGTNWVYWDNQPDCDIGTPFADGTVVQWVDPLPQLAPPIVQVPLAPEEEQLFTVTLADAGPTRVGVIKAIREVLGLGLGESKAFVEAAPKVVKDGLSRAEANTLQFKLASAGAVVTITA